MKFLRSLYFFCIASLFLTLAMCFPQQFSYFIFIFLVPVLFFLSKHVIDFPKKTSLLFLRMFLLLFFSLLFSTVWVLKLYPLDWIGIVNTQLSFVIVFSIWVIFAVVMALPLSFWIVIVSRFAYKNIILQAFFGAAAWVFLEYIRTFCIAIILYGNEVIFGADHTYYSLAYTVASVPFLKDMLPIGGIYATSFIIIVINYSCYYILHNLMYAGDKRYIVSLVMVIILVVSSAHFYMTLLRKEGIHKKEITISVVTTNSPPKLNLEMEKKRQEIIFNVITKIKNDDGIVVVPENFNYVTPFLENDSLHQSNLIPKNHLIIGSYHINNHFILYFFDPVTHISHHYAKQLLMPIAEYDIAWLKYVLVFIQNQKITETFEGFKNTGRKGNSILIYNETSKNIAFSGGLCSENISPYIYRNETKSGAEILVNLSSHSDFHDGSPLLFRQTLAINMTRALENGRYLITSTNKDKSFVITDSGSVQDISTSTREVSYFNSLVRGNQYMTPYVKYGDYMVIFSCMIMMIGSIWYS